MFVHLSARSTYSLLEWLGSINDLLARIGELWQTAVAIADLYGMYGAVDFYSKAKSTNIKPIIGVEIPFVPYLSAYRHQRNTKIPTITLLVANPEGYHQLMRLVSDAYGQAVDELPVVDLPLLERHHEGIIAVLGGLWSYVSYQDATSLETTIDQCIHCLGSDNVLIAITAQSYTHYPELQSLHTSLRHYAQEKSLTTVAISQFYYILESHKSIYHSALAIKDGKKIYDADARHVKGDHHILSEEDVRKHLVSQWWSAEQIDLMIHNTVAVADRIETKITLGQALFPNFTPSPEILEIYEKVKGELVEKG